MLRSNIRRFARGYHHHQHSRESSFNKLIVVVRRRQPEPEAEDTIRWRLLSAVGLCLTGASVAQIAITRRPSRASLAMFGSGTVMTLLGNPQLFSPWSVSGIAVGGALLLFGPIYVQDSFNQEAQRISMEAIEKLHLPSSFHFDDSGPAGHAFSKPHFEIITGPAHAIWSQSKESVRVNVAGYEIDKVGERTPIVYYVYASRKYPWEHFNIDRIELCEDSKTYAISNRYPVSLSATATT